MHRHPEITPSEAIADPLVAMLAARDQAAAAANRQPQVAHPKPGAVWAFVASSAFKTCSLCGSDTCRSHACYSGAL